MYATDSVIHHADFLTLPGVFIMLDILKSVT